MPKLPTKKPTRVTRRLSSPTTSASAAVPIDALHTDLRLLIAGARQRTAAAVNAELTLLYWNVGHRLLKDTLENARAAYGAKVITQIGERLSHEFGRGFEPKNLRRMIQFAQAFPDAQIVASLMRQLSWTHFIQILPHKNPPARQFYAQMAVTEGWSVRELRQRMEDKTYERTQLAHPEKSTLTPALTQFSTTGQTSPDLVFKDPYFLEFLGLPPGHDERTLESAILRDMERFILELGRGFTFVARQKRMVIDGEDFSLDLLFFHRRLRRLVAVELKIGKFKAAHKGQMELYLKWLDRYERQPGEEAPLGLILCAESSREQVELLEMHKDGIMVAEYWTELPPKAEWARHLHQALIEAQERLATREVWE